MSEATDKIREHFNAMGVREIIVNEWELTIYATPVTLSERQRIYSRSKGDNDYEVLAAILIAKAQDKDGTKMFTIEDKAVLLQRADSAVLIRVAAEIMNGGPPAAELKN